MGPTNAIPFVLKGEPFPLLTSQIAEKLQAGGVRSQATDFPASVSATLGQLRDKGVVEKVGDGWRLKLNDKALDDALLEGTVLMGTDGKNKSADW
jgi:hypothetical protein